MWTLWTGESETRDREVGEGRAVRGYKIDWKSERKILVGRKKYISKY